MPNIIYVVILFLALEFLSIPYQRLINRFVILRGTLFLGIFIHEFSHYLGCKLTRAPVAEFKVGLREGHVTHGKSKIPLLGGLIISLAPLIVGIVLLLLLFQWLTGLSYKELTGVWEAGASGNLSGIFTNIKQGLGEISVLSWQFWLGVYFVFNILAIFVPSKQDFKNIAGALVLYVFLSAAFGYFQEFNMLIIQAMSFAILLLLIALGLLSGLNFLKGLVRSRKNTTYEPMN